jgi:hypothetical protein
MATIINSQKAMPVSIKRDVPVVEGAKGFIINFDFTSSSLFSLVINAHDYGISFIQTLFIDNSNSSTSTTITFVGTTQKVVCPAYSQGFFPILLNGPQLSATISCSGSVVVPIQFINQYIEMYLWSVQTPGSIPGTVTISGTVTTNPLAVTMTSKAGNIAAGGSSQTLMAANGLRRGLFIQNPTDETGQGIANREPLYINYTSAAGVNDGVSIELQPGAALTFNGNTCPTSLVTVNAATTSHKYIAFEGA